MNFELIVVDDGSVDGTGDIVEGLGDPRVRVERTPGLGTAGARNRGLEVARGEYVAFLDADDYWFPRKLERQLALLRAEPDLVGVGSRARYFSERARNLGVSGDVMTPARLRRTARGSFVPFPISTLMVRLEDARAIGFDQQLSTAEDLQFFAELAARGRLATVPEVLAGYRMHGAAKSQLDFNEQMKQADFIRSRLRARAAGGDLTVEEFEATFARSRRAQRRLRGQYCYRTAGLMAAEGRPFRAVGYALAGLALHPRHVLEKVFRQQLLRRLPRVRRP